MDAKRCKDLSASDFVNRLESGAGDVRKVVRNRNKPTDSQKGLPMQPRIRHELSAPTVDLITGKCIPGKMIGTVSASPLTVDMTVSCRPEPEHMQQGVNADGLPLTKSVGFSVADVNTSTAVATPPGLGGSDEGPTSKKSPPDDWSESSELLPSFGGLFSSSASSSPTLPWGTAEGLSPSFSPNRVKEGTLIADKSEFG